MFNRIDHIGIAVASIDESLALYENGFQMKLVHRERVDEQGVEAVLLDIGENHVELLEPLAPDTPVGNFLAKRGQGIHHVAYQVTDIEQAIEHCRTLGLQLIDQTPRIGIRDSRVAFLHPKATAAVLTELVQPAHSH